MEEVEQVQDVRTACVELDLLSRFGLLKRYKDDHTFIFLTFVILLRVVLVNVKVQIVVIVFFALWDRAEKLVVVLALYDPLLEDALFFL